MENLKEKLDDLKQFMIDDFVDRNMGGLESSFAKIRDERLKKYNAQNAPEAMASIAREINGRYNRRDTDEAKWVDLKVQFLEYSAKNYQELEQLKKLKSEFEFLKADYLAQRAEDAYKELVAEEKELLEKVENLDPENYKASGHEAKFNEDSNKASGLIQERLSLYRAEGRSPLLRAYNRQIRDSRGDLARVANEYGGKEEQSTLESLTQSAQAFREKAGVKDRDRDFIPRSL
ncbi:MAG: hypothetical protein PHH93_10230 [Prolixibacteraceae bacterium]|nr:hypothetical protein [Prolixibacteraceae bacterium]